MRKVILARGEDDEEANRLVDDEFGHYRTGGGITDIIYKIIYGSDKENYQSD